MKTCKILLFIAVTVLGASALGQNKSVPAFSAKGTDGKTYSKKSFSEGEPILLVFFSAGCPHNVQGIKDMNRLDRMVQGKVRIIGMTDLDVAQSQILAHNHHARFPILADPTGKTIGKFGGQSGLDNVLILPDGHIARVWNGYNRSTLKQFEALLGSRTHLQLNLTLSEFPKDREIGCAISMSM
jgi:peroxiredoxin